MFNLSSSEAYHLFPSESQEPPHTAQVMALALLQDFSRLAQEKDQRQLVDGYIRDIMAAELYEPGPKSNLLRLTTKALLACRKDPDWERGHGISDYVICRECGVMLKEHLGTKKGHLWRQHSSMSVQDYHAAYPNAPLQTCRRLAKYRGRDVQELMATPFSPPRGHRAWLQRVTSQELEACREDPAWEARHGISDRQVCRICAALVKTALGDKKGHLWMVHRTSVANYRLAFPGARVRPFKAEILDGKTRGGGYDVQQFMATFSSKFLLPEELEACRKDTEWERHHNLTDVVVCRECGKKLSNIPGSHLRPHGLTRKEYLTKYPLAPMRAAKFTAQATAWAQRHRANFKEVNRLSRMIETKEEELAKLKEDKEEALAKAKKDLEAAKAETACAQRPANWDEKEKIWHVAYEKLWSLPGKIWNPELKAHLLKMCGECPSDRTIHRMRVWAKQELTARGRPK